MWRRELFAKCILFCAINSLNEIICKTYIFAYKYLRLYFRRYFMNTVELSLGTFNIGILATNLQSLLSYILLAVQVLLIVTRIILKIIKVVREKKVLSKEDCDIFFSEEVKDLQLLKEKLEGNNYVQN